MPWLISVSLDDKALSREAKQSVGNPGHCSALLRSGGHDACAARAVHVPIFRQPSGENRSLVSCRVAHLRLVRCRCGNHIVVPVLLRSTKHRARREGTAATLSGLMTSTHLTNRCSQPLAD